MTNLPFILYLFYPLSERSEDRMVPIAAQHDAARRASRLSPAFLPFLPVRVLRSLSTRDILWA